MVFSLDFHFRLPRFDFRLSPFPVRLSRKSEVESRKSKVEDGASIAQFPSPGPVDAAAPDW